MLQIGIISRIDADKHVFFADLDTIRFDGAVSQAKQLQETFNLPNVYVIETSPTRFSLMSLCKRSFNELVKMLCYTDSDIKFRRNVLKQGYATIRLTEKFGATPNLRCIVIGKPDEVSVDELKFVRYKIGYDENHEVEVEITGEDEINALRSRVRQLLRMKQERR